MSSSRRSELRSSSSWDPRNMLQMDEMTRLLLHLHREPIFMHIFIGGHRLYRQQFLCGRASTSNTTCSTIRLINKNAAFLVFCMAMNSSNCKRKTIFIKYFIVKRMYRISVNINPVCLLIYHKNKESIQVIITWKTEFETI